MSMNKILAIASEIAKKGTFHARNNRLSEAVYLYQLSIKFMDHIIEGCARDPSVFPEQSLEIVKRSREGYMNFIRQNSEFLPQGHQQQQQQSRELSPSPGSVSPGLTPSPSTSPPIQSAATAPQDQEHREHSQPQQKQQAEKRTQIPIRQPIQPPRPMAKAPPTGNLRPPPSTATRVEPGFTKSRNRLSLPGSAPPLPAPVTQGQQQQQQQQSQPPSLRASPGLSSGPGIVKPKAALPFHSEPPQPRSHSKGPTTSSESSSGSLSSSSDSRDDESNPLMLIKRAVEEKRANKLNDSIQTYERVIELIMQENKELKTKVEQQHNQIKILNQSQSQSQSQSSSNSSHRNVQPITTASAHEGSRSRGHLLKRSSTGSSSSGSSSSSSSSLSLPTNDLISVLEHTTNTSTIDYVNDKVDLHERLGGGGSGAVVMRATCKGLTFAAKVLPGEMPAEVRDAVLSEIHVMTRLDHQNVVKYLGHDLSKSKKIMLFMEYYTETLAGVLKKRKEEDAWTTPEEVTKWSMQIAKGLQYLHSLSPPLIHRDLKSENVFVLYDSQGRVETLKIGDFDTAKITEKTKATFTRNLGTVGFMAPEVCNPTEKGYNEKADSKERISIILFYSILFIYFHFL